VEIRTLMFIHLQSPGFSISKGEELGKATKMLTFLQGVGGGMWPQSLMGALQKPFLQVWHYL
jgi:hypothetical protein